MQINVRRCGLILCGVFLLLSLLLPLGPVTSLHAQSDDRILFNAANAAYFYFGRYQPGESVLWTWPGSGLRVMYDNSHTVKLRVFADNFKEDSSFTIGRVVWYRIDRGNWIQFSMAGGDQRDVSLTVPFDLGHHTIEVIKASEGQLTFQGLLLEKGGNITPSVNPGRKIEIIGDSISAGFKVYGNGNFESPGLHDAKASYGWLLGDRLNADVRLIAVTNRGVVHDFGHGPGDSRTIAYYYPELQREYKTPNDWSWQPNVIIINLGTNDMAPPAPTSPADFQWAFTNFVATVRNYNPGAIILAMAPFGERSGAVPIYSKEIEAAVALRRAAGDSHIAFVNTNGWLGVSDFTDSIHPNVTGHIKAANHLFSIIRSVDGGAALPGPAVAANHVVSTATPAPSVASVSCPGAPLSRLIIGQKARVAVDGRGPSPIFDKPGGKVITRANEGTILKVFDGPRCYVRALFWLVYLPDGTAGWVNEGDHSAYFIEPYAG